MQEHRYSVPALLILAHVTADIVLCFSKVINLADELGEVVGLRGVALEVLWDLPEHVVWGCVLGQMGLVAVWLALGRSRPLRRLCVALWVLACLWTIWSFAENPSRTERASILNDAGNALQWSLVVVAGVFFCTLRWRRRGWRLAWAQASRSALALPMRFTIAQLLLLMLLMAVVLGTAETNAWHIAVGVLACLLTMLGIGMAWVEASLMVRWIAATVLSIALGAMLTARMEAPDMRSVIGAAFLCVSGTWTVGVTALVLRRAGYGLVEQPASPVGRPVNP